MPTELFPFKSIDIQQRIRGVDDDIAYLADSIKRYGLLQPILLNQHNVLVDGFRRYSAWRCLADLDPAKYEFVPVHRREQMSEAEYFEIELETNVRRRQFTWQENIKAVCRVHRTRKREAVLQHGTVDAWTLAMTGELLGGYSPAYVHNCLSLEPVIDTPDYKDCSGITDAVRLFEHKKEDLAMAEIAKRTVANFKPSYQPPHTQIQCVACTGVGKNSKGDLCFACQGTGFQLNETEENGVDVEELLDGEVPELVVSLSQSVMLGDSVRDLLPKFPAECVDHIITDPPFAIDVDQLQQSSQALIDVSRVRDTHQVGENLELHELMFKEFFRVLKDGGFCIVWLDIMHWQHEYDLATAAGFRVQRWPHVWCKTSQCKNQMAHQNETKATEFAMFCRKGNATLPSPISKNFTLAGGLDEKLSNPFAKPFAVWTPLINYVSIEGQTILDPFAGEGTCPTACLSLGRPVIAIERDPVHYNYLLEFVKQHWLSVHPNVKFT